MSDVFISYSRLDSDFVGKLREALAEHGQDVWIDWESIPESRAWWEEIKKGIVHANNFAVILSPNSMASPICQMEIEYAIELKKRIIPVYHIDFNREDELIGITKRLARSDQSVTREIWENRQPHDLYDSNDATLKRINYFFFKETDDFQTRFNDLLGVIHTDYDHKERHTTLELRAQEWHKRNKDSGFLLIDNELTEAQTWLAESTGKDPIPTNLHQAYIKASRHFTDQRKAEAATRQRQIQRLRLATITAISAVIVAAIVALNAINEQARTNDQVVAARTQVAIIGETATAIPPTLDAVLTDVKESENRSESLRLAAESRALMDKGNANAPTAALLAIRALQHSYSFQADEILIDAVEQLESVQTFEGAVLSSAFTPDERFLVLGYGDGTIKVWDLQSQQLSFSLDDENVDRVLSMDISPDERHLVTGHLDGQIKVWDLQEREQVSSFQGHTRNVIDLTFSPDGLSFASGSDYDSRANIWLFTPECMSQLKGISQVITEPVTVCKVTMVTEIESINDWAFTYRHGVTSVDIDVTGKYLLVGGRDGGGLWDIVTAREVNMFGGILIRQAAFTPDGQSVLTIDANGNVKLWDIDSGEDAEPWWFERPHDGEQPEILDIAISLDSQYILTGGADNTARLWDIEQHQQLALYPHLGSVDTVAFSSDGRYVLTGGWYGATLSETLPQPGITTLFTRPAFDIGNWSNTWRRGQPTLKEFAISPNNSTIMTTTNAGMTGASIQVWDMVTGKPLPSNYNYYYWVGLVDYTTNGAYAYAIGDVCQSSVRNCFRQVSIWDTSDFDSIKTFTIDLIALLGAVLSNDARYLVTVTYDNDNETYTLNLWDRQVLDSKAETDTPLPFSPEEITNSIILPLSGTDDSPPFNLIMNTDASEVTVLRDDHVWVWHTDNNTIREDLEVIQPAMPSTERELSDFSIATGVLAISPDNHLLVIYRQDSETGDNKVQVIPNDYGDMVDFACSRLSFDLTDDERIEYKIEDNTVTCDRRASLTPPRG